MKKAILYLFLIILFTQCEKDQEAIDCNGVIDGTAFVDDCGVCSGGTTGHVANSDKDACGVCFGNGSSCNSEIIDGSGNVYDTVRVGNKVWLKQNLRALHFLDGTAIPNSLSDYGWYNTTSPALEVIDDNIVYNFYALSTKAICPNGFRVPTPQDWREAIILLSDSIKPILLNNNYPGTRHAIGDILYVDEYAIFYTCENDSTKATVVSFQDTNSDIFFYASLFQNGYSCKCIK